jgi:hypothetical protein
MSQALLDRMLEDREALPVSAETLEGALVAGVCMLMLTGDPDKDVESADVAVVARELTRGFGFRLLIADRAGEAALMERTRAPVLPALVFFRDGQQCLTIPRIKAWSYYEMKAREIAALQTEAV